MKRNCRSGKRPKWSVLSLRRRRKRKRRRFVYKVHVFKAAIEEIDF